MDIYKRVLLSTFTGMIVGAIVGGLFGYWELSTWNISAISEDELQYIISKNWMFGIGVAGTFSLLTYIWTGDFIWNLMKKNPL